MSDNNVTEPTNDDNNVTEPTNNDNKLYHKFVYELFKNKK